MIYKFRFWYRGIILSRWSLRKQWLANPCLHVIHMTQSIALKFTNPSSFSFLHILTHNSHAYGSTDHPSIFAQPSNTCSRINLASTPRFSLAEAGRPTSPHLNHPSSPYFPSSPDLTVLASLRVLTPPFASFSLENKDECLMPWVLVSQPHPHVLLHQSLANTSPNSECGAISFKTPLPKPLAVYICHCDECRRQSSSAFGCSAIFPAFPLPANVKGALSVYSYVLPLFFLDVLFVKSWLCVPLSNSFSFNLYLSERAYLQINVS